MVVTFCNAGEIEEQIGERRKVRGLFSTRISYNWKEIMQEIAVVRLVACRVETLSRNDKSQEVAQHSLKL